MHLIKNGADPNELNNVGLNGMSVMAALGDVSSIKTTLEHGGDPASLAKQEWSPRFPLNLITWVFRKKLERDTCFDYLTWFLTSSEGSSALHRAAEAWTTEAVKLLLEARADATILTKAGFTPLDFAKTM